MTPGWPRSLRRRFRPAHEAVGPDLAQRPDGAHMRAELTARWTALAAQGMGHRRSARRTSLRDRERHPAEAACGTAWPDWKEASV